MKEFSLPINLFQTGLRKDDTRQLNVPGLVECYGFKVDETGLVIPDTMTNPFTTSEAVFDWPFPQVFRFAKATYLLTRHYFYSVDSSWNLTQKTAWFFEGECWDAVDYQDYVLFNNGTQIILIDPLTDDYYFPDTTQFPACRTFCDLNGQLVIGDTALGDSVVQWSDIGSAEFTLKVGNEAGYYMLPWDGPVLRVKKLGEGVIVYGENGIFLMSLVTAPATTFQFALLANYGIASRGAVGGDDRAHVFVDEKGYLRQITPDWKITNLGYKEFFSTFLGKSVSIVYNPLEEEYHLSDGVRSFHMTRSGVAETNRIVSSGEVFDGEFVALYSDTAGAYRTVVSNPFDMALRNGKTITQVAVSTTTPRQTQVAIDWRNTGSSTFTRSPFFVLNDEGFAEAIVAGCEFRLVVRTPIAYEPEFNGRAFVNWKLTDKRTVRGVYVPAQDNG